jgi:hypothetical protein
MSKVYMFGCSHVAGHELGKKSVDYKKFMRARGFTDTTEAQDSLSSKEYEDKIMIPWLKQIKNKQTPLCSWAGQIAQKLNKNFVNYAEIGSSFDYQSYKLLEIADDIDWDKDLVLFGIPVPNRYMTYNEGCLKATQVSHIYNSHPRLYNILLRSLPSDETLMLFHYSLVTYLKTKFPKVILCEMYPNKKNIFHIDNIFYVQQSLHDFSLQFRDRFYPARHYKEHVHEKYAEYVLEKLTKDKTYSNIVV